MTVCICHNERQQMQTSISDDLLRGQANLLSGWHLTNNFLVLCVEQWGKK